MRTESPAFHKALLRIEKRRIGGVVSFIAFFSVLKLVRIFVFREAMHPAGLLAAGLLIGFEIGLLNRVNRALRMAAEIPDFIWYLSIALESIFPAVGIALFASSRLLLEYRALATPWVLAFFPFILLSVLRLSPKVSWFSGITAGLGYLIAAHAVGWRLDRGVDGFTVTQTAVVYFACVLCVTGVLAGGVAAAIRIYFEAALREASTRHQLKELEHDLQIARSIQQSLLPKVQPQIHGFQIAGWSRTADDTGGDFYDWKKLSDGRWVMVLADVTGHGIGPAILASVCRAYSRATFNTLDNLGTMLKNINLSFAEDLTPERFATFVAATCQEGNDEVELLSAGHGPILLYHSKDESLSFLEAQALPLGILPDLWQAVPVKFQLKPGDIIMLITDGFVEWENKSGEQFGTERVAAVVRRFRDREASIIIAELHDAVLKFSEGTPQQDDLTAVVIKRSHPERGDEKTPEQQMTCVA